MLDLTQESNVVKFMQESGSADDYSKRCNIVKKANGGKYPDFWYKAIVQSGISSRFGELEMLVFDNKQDLLDYLGIK